MFFKKRMQLGEKILFKSGSTNNHFIKNIATQSCLLFPQGSGFPVISHVQNRMKTSTVSLCWFPSATNDNLWSLLHRVFLLCSCCYFTKNLQSLILCVSLSTWRETTLENIMARWSQDARILQMFAKNYWKMLQFDKSRKC